MGNASADSWTLYRRLLGQARPSAPHRAGLVALSLLAPALKLLAPVPLKFAVDGVLGGRPPAALASLSGPALLAVAGASLVAVTLLALLVGLAASVVGAYV